MEFQKSVPYKAIGTDFLVRDSLSRGIKCKRYILLGFSLYAICITRSAIGFSLDFVRRLRTAVRGRPTHVRSRQTRVC